MRNNLCIFLFIGLLGYYSKEIRADESRIFYQKGLASLYDFPGDKFSGQHVYACERRLRLKDGEEKWLLMLEHGVAHRNLPCGSKVEVCTESSIKKKNPICTIAYVIDRGPYGALNEKNEWFVRAKLQPGERWRGIMDLRPSVAHRLSFNGLERIQVFYYKEVK